MFAISSRISDKISAFGINAQSIRTTEAKAKALSAGELKLTPVKGRKSTDPILIGAKAGGSTLGQYATAFQGTSPGDGDRFVRTFWEKQELSDRWIYFQNTPDGSSDCSGKSYIIKWEEVDAGFPGAAIRGREAWGKTGLVTTKISPFPVALYWGDKFSTSSPVIIPKDSRFIHPILNFMRSAKFKDVVQSVNSAFGIGNGYFQHLPFDPSEWADEIRPKLAPFSSNPTRWLFSGHPASSEPGMALHVALARLCGYRWPAETDSDMRLSDETRAWIAKTAALPSGDNDGLLGVPPVAGEKPLADRLRAYLAAAFGAEWSDALERRLVAEGDEAFDKKSARDGSLEAWVRDRAFRQHCALFGQRPFVWHISDGLKDGFSVFVHYHRFDQANLRKLTYTLLGDWLARAKAENNTLRYEKGRELQQKLEKILEGERPFDIFVRWKSIAQQPLGWDPDLDDGVRQNIRPFIKAGVLTHDLSKILKDKDRGNDVSSAPWYDVFKGERRNDHHTTLAEKRAARDAAAKRVEAAK